MPWVLKDEINNRPDRYSEYRRWRGEGQDSDYNFTDDRPERWNSSWRSDFDRSAYGPSNSPASSWVYFEDEWLIPGPFTGMGPKGYQRSDERIRDDACARLTRHGRLDASDINVEVNNGELTLGGTVRSRRDKRQAEDTVESIPGVTDVHNHLHVREAMEHEEKTGMAQKEV